MKQQLLWDEAVGRLEVAGIAAELRHVAASDRGHVVRRRDPPAARPEQLRPAVVRVELPRARCVQELHDLGHEQVRVEFDPDGPRHGRAAPRAGPGDGRRLRRRPSESARAAAAVTPPREPHRRPSAMTDDRAGIVAPEAASLNPRYTFDTFVAGPSNQLAFAASQAAASSYPPKYNPVFICGGVGLGKTHLLHAIGHQQLAQPPRRAHRLHLERAVHERVRAGDPHRQDARVPAQLPRGHRRPARRRRAVPRRQGEHAGRVLPHVQRAPREPQADRADGRPQAARDLRHRRSPAHALRVGPARRHRAARARGAHRDPAQEGRRRGGHAARRRRALHRDVHQVATSASSRARSSGSPRTPRCRSGASTSSSPRRRSAPRSRGRARSSPSTASSRPSRATTASSRATSRASAATSRSRRRARSRCTSSRHHTKDSYPDLARAFGGKHHTTVISAVQKIAERLKDDASLRAEIHAIEGDDPADDRGPVRLRLCPDPVDAICGRGLRVTATSRLSTPSLHVIHRRSTRRRQTAVVPSSNVMRSRVAELVHSSPQRLLIPTSNKIFSSDKR